MSAATGEGGTLAVTNNPPEIVLEAMVVDGELQFKSPAGHLHQMGDCLRVKAGGDGIVSVLFKIVHDDGDGVDHNVYGTVRIDEPGAQDIRWTADNKVVPIDTGNLAIRLDEDGRRGHGFRIRAGNIDLGATVRLTFSSLYWLRGDDGTRVEYAHGDPNVVITRVSDPAAGSEPFPPC